MKTMFMESLTSIRRIVFWQNVLSIHQSAFVRELAETPGLEVWFAYEEDLPESRRAMGWTIPDFGRANVVDVRISRQCERLLAMNDTQTCHVFGGYMVLPVAGAAFRHLLGTLCKRAWISEAFDFHGWRGRLRVMRLRWQIHRNGKDAFHRIFAMGALGVEFFQRCGYPTAIIREFAYLVEPPSVTDYKRDSKIGPFKFVFVGQLIRRKGIDLLLDALAPIGVARDWQLDIVGDGSESAALAMQARAAGIESRITFHGNVANSRALQFIAEADCLVLPSRWDGWGAVVNEALMRGTPVVASDTCGAASLLVETLLGAVFRNGNRDQLRQRLQDRMNTNIPREQIQNWASHAITSAPLVSYFISELQSQEASVTSCPPWKNSNQYLI